MSSRSGRRRDRSYSSSRSGSPDRRRRRRRRHSSSSNGSSADSDRHYRSRRGETRESDRHRRRRDYSSERSRPKDKRDRHRSRSRSSHRDSKRKKEHKRHDGRSRSRERTKSKKQSKDKEKAGKSSDAKGENPAEALKARVKALLDKSSEGTAKAAAVEMSGTPVPTPGQTALIESNSFTSDKFVSKRSSKKWDVPPSGVSQKKTVSAGKTFDVTTVDPSEFVPKVVPMCEVENALGREEGMGEMEEGGGRGVVSIRQETTQSTSETEPVDRNQKWLQKLKKMRQRFADPPTN